MAFESMVEDIEDLLNCNDKTDVQQIDTIKANILIQELKQRLGKEKCLLKNIQMQQTSSFKNLVKDYHGESSSTYS
jgi:predicted RNA-binding protein with RPS1 domain